MHCLLYPPGAAGAAPRGSESRKQASSGWLLALSMSQDLGQQLSEPARLGLWAERATRGFCLRAGSFLTLLPKWLSLRGSGALDAVLDPDTAGAAGERPQRPAGPPAAGELHPEGRLEPGHEPGGEQVSPACAPSCTWASGPASRPPTPAPGAGGHVCAPWAAEQSWSWPGFASQGWGTVLSIHFTWSGAVAQLDSQSCREEVSLVPGKEVAG